MANLINPTHIDQALAVGLGRFAQACVYLERQIELSLFRMLPVTDDIGRVLLSGNQMRRNLEIMKALTVLPDVPLTDEVRPLIRDLCLRCNSINDDRSRLLHNPIISGKKGYMIVLHKQHGKGSSAMPISAAMMIERADKAERLAYDLLISIPSLDYDTSHWRKVFPSYPVKDYPTGKTQDKSPHNHQK